MDPSLLSPFPAARAVLGGPQLLFLEAWVLFVCLPSDRNTVNTQAASCGMVLSARKGRGLTVTSGVNLSVFCSGPFHISLFLGELVSPRIWSLGATGDHRTEFLTTGPARQPAPLDLGQTGLRSDAYPGLAPTLPCASLWGLGGTSSLATGSFPRTQGFFTGLAQPDSPLRGLALVTLLHLYKQRDRISSPRSLLKLSRQSNHSREGPERPPGNPPKAFSLVSLGSNPPPKRPKSGVLVYMCALWGNQARPEHQKKPLAS